MAQDKTLMSHISPLLATQPLLGLSPLSAKLGSHGVYLYVPSIDVGYQYAMRSTASSITVATGDGTVFPLAANALGRGLTTVGASITAKEGATWDVSLGYQGAFASGMHDNAFSVGFTKHF